MLLAVKALLRLLQLLLRSLLLALALRHGAFQACHQRWQELRLIGLPALLRLLPLLLHLLLLPLLLLLQALLLLLLQDHYRYQEHIHQEHFQE